jgi:hypothetical protein
MAVLFPTQFGQTLDPKKAPQLLQGFLNIQNVEGVQTGTLTKSNLDSYAQKRFLAADPSSTVAGYLTQNFNAIAKLDGNANSISADDLVQIRQDLPTAPDVPTQPPTQNPSLQDSVQLILYFILQLFQQIFSV